ncbi:unnamed protein product [Heligmosomoides polygyrus]|uniref:Ovule protein n=1 Tax=Heligmosomoides polygyrus TaxID=6339 RepID=A0A183GKT5_HELPZ|nr:unnamed protein product [Heligmosomoides polygyrus]
MPQHPTTTAKRNKPENNHNFYKKPLALRCIWEATGGQFHNKIDHIMFICKFYLMAVSVIPNFNLGPPPPLHPDLIKLPTSHPGFFENPRTIVVFNV